MVWNIIVIAFLVCVPSSAIAYEFALMIQGRDACALEAAVGQAKKDGINIQDRFIYLFRYDDSYGVLFSLKDIKLGTWEHSTMGADVYEVGVSLDGTILCSNYSR